jgi:hypothetical protein
MFWPLLASPSMRKRCTTKPLLCPNAGNSDDFDCRRIRGKLCPKNDGHQVDMKLLCVVIFSGEIICNENCRQSCKNVENRQSSAARFAIAQK